MNGSSPEESNIGISTQEIAELCNGCLEGDPKITIHGISTLGEAGKGDIAVLRDPSGREEAAHSDASALIASDPVDGFQGVQITVEDPETALAELLDFFHSCQTRPTEGINPYASVSPSASLGEAVSVGHSAVIEDGACIGAYCIIYPTAYIGYGVQIGAGTIIYPHASVMASSAIGKNCIIGPNAVIGDEGFGFIQRDGASRRLHHTGGVRIGDNVEVGGMSSIDRGMLDDTVVGDGTIIDKHCMIAHNCKIGKNCILAGYSRMAGSVNIGDGAILAADVRISDHKNIGEKAILAAATGVTRDVEPGEVVWGTPTRPIKTQARIQALEGRLPELFKRVREIEKMLAQDRK